MILKTWRLGVLAVNMCFTVSVFAQTPSPTPLTIDQSNVPIRVDGHLNDWPSARMIFLNRKDQITTGERFWKGEDDFTGRVFLTYDAEFLYVSAIVQKTGKVVNDNDPASLWNADCLELFLSTQSNHSDAHHLSRGDYHIGFSPGTGCARPQMYCFNKDTTIPGGRIVSRKTVKGYLLEACIPLTFFEGLALGPGKNFVFDVALDEGGELSGYRILQMDYAGKDFDGEDPSTWPLGQWIGQVEQTVPLAKTTDLNADLVKDGTTGATYAGRKNIDGVAVDNQGKALKGVHVSTWPKTAEVLTDNQGRFQLSKIKIYDKTVFYGRLDGYIGTLSPWQSHAKAVTLRLSLLPPGLGPSYGRVSPFFIGFNIPAKDPSQVDWTSALKLGSALKPGIIRLDIDPSLALSQGGSALLDKFVAYAKQLRAEPLVTVPINSRDPEKAAQWVHYANVDKNYKIRFWVVGYEPDMGVPGSGNYNSYDYINDFRAYYNSMKKEDPSILIQGPEVAWKYTQAENDWITPFVQYDGDITNGISIHHYASTESISSLSTIQKDMPKNSTLLLTLQDKVSQITDSYLPLAVTEENLYYAPVTARTKDEGVTLDFWGALWEADKKGSFLKDHLVMDVSSGDWLPIPSASVSNQVNPTYCVLKLWSEMDRGKVIGAQIQRPEMSVYATQDPTTKDVTVMIINKGDHYWRPKFMLNAEDTELSVDAGLDQRYDFEIPAFSISCLKLKADRSAGEATVYTLKMALAGREPQTSVIKPW